MPYPTQKWRGAFSAGLFSLVASTTTLAHTEPNTIYEEIITLANPLSAEGITQPIHALTGDALDRAVANSLGETLQNIPGVHSASFGQAVGRPIIRGLGGPRVKIMEDRIDSLDVSVSSPDHITTIEPFAAQSIEVLKGPSTLLYGSGAIGGVINVDTGRIPHKIPEKISAIAEIRGADNANQRTTAGRINGGSGNFAFHIDGFYRDANEYDIPGLEESAYQHMLEETEDAHEEEGEDDERNSRGILSNSQLQTQGGAFGLSYIGETDFIGFAISTYNAEYGLPGHGHEHDEADNEHSEEGVPPILDLDQTRIDIEGGFETPFEKIHNINIRIGLNDYKHIEIEGSEHGTVFATNAWESRLEVTHDTIFGFKSATGIQLSNREFSAQGEEAFVQPVDTRSLGLFSVAQQRFGSLGMEAGVRYEHVNHEPSSSTVKSRSFDLSSASLGFIQFLSDNWTLSEQLDFSNRAPVAEELYSNGPHLATQSFELGNNNLDEETATNASANLRYSGETLSFSLIAYITKFNDFIFEANTNLKEDELPVYQWTQGDATFHGLEADATWQAMQWSSGTLTFNAGFDSVNARLNNGENRNIPRTPPFRWRLGAIASWNALQTEITWRQIADQNDLAFAELPTDGYDDLRIHIAYTLDLREKQVNLFLSGRNLTDDEQRLHTSFIGQLAPQPGRTIEAGFRLHL